MSLTPAQLQAIAARGNVLVVAGAGTGKTRTLVERCLNCLLEERPPASLDEILMVTFTEAAAAEMRQRIRARLEEELKNAELNGAPAKVLHHWHEQLALFEAAHIGTLHSFCLKLVRQHFYELGLDPQLSVLAEEESHLLAQETLEQLLQRHYAGQTGAAKAVLQLIQTQVGGSDQPVRALVLRLHEYTQTLASPSAWLDNQLAAFGSCEPKLWENWLLCALTKWSGCWQPLLHRNPAENEISGKCVKALETLHPGMSRSEADTALRSIAAASGNCASGKKMVWLKPLKNFLSEAAFFCSLTRVKGETDPLAEDWGWVRSQMVPLLELARDFGKAFTEAKRELGVMDFHDLEQHALRLLWDTGTGQPTRIAQRWRRKLRFVFVDEYQDINAAQDKIIEALSREGVHANRFLVGDVKQSIYRFRLANPYIFKNYADLWRDDQGQVISLADNFRSREQILQFVNSFFGTVMRPDAGGLQYDEQARLRFGAPQERRALSLAGSSAPCVELHLRIKGDPNHPEGDEDAVETQVNALNLLEVEKEARLVALRLRELKADACPVWDEPAKQFRPVDWRDMAVLLRSPANKSESYAKEFSRLNIPLQVSRPGFYENVEISDLLSLLQLLDNPLQDLPVLAVLHSPLVGMTLNELATIRLTAKAPFWTALVLWQEAQIARLNAGKPKPDQTKDATPLTPNPAEAPTTAETLRKVTLFLQRFAHWRRLARQVSLSHCLEAVLTETHYADWLLTQPRGQQRYANVDRLLGLARRFDDCQRQGLFRFLRFVETQRAVEVEPEVATVNDENSVRLMSIHQSKGLEFPVVAVADLGKPFNLSDLRSEIILDEVYGLCPQIKPPHTGARYPSLPYWLACRHQLRELLGEELRLLYVAITRARDKLVLSATLSTAKFNHLWRQAEEADPAELLSARSFSDWLGFWFSKNFSLGEDAPTQGANACLRWEIHDGRRLAEPDVETAPPGVPAESVAAIDPEAWAQLKQRLAWRYPFAAATRQPAKTSVSALRRNASEQMKEEAAFLFGSEWAGYGPEAQSPQPGNQVSMSAPNRHRATSPAKAAAADIGTAHHSFLQLVSLQRVGSAKLLKQEAGRLVQEGALTPDTVTLLDFEGLADFWSSELGRRVQAQATWVRRELAFTVRFSQEELSALAGQPTEPDLKDEFVVVQGAVDLAVVLPGEIWVLDFKTDTVPANELPEKIKSYEPQLKLYAGALSKIYQRPVSACWLCFLAARTAVPFKPG